MGKISPVSAKYIIHASIKIEGTVEKPDIIGAIFGQTEGLLGTELELRELQKSGRIGRIEVNLETKSGKTAGEIIIPSSLDKAETAIIAAAIETIERIGPCESKVKIESIEDVRISKRDKIMGRAKDLLKNLTETTPESQELTEEVSQSVRTMEIREYGKDRLPAGPAIEEAEEIIIVEGRADVVNLLKHGIKNVIGLNGTGIPDSIKDLSKQKTVTVFVDGDRGGDLIIKELSSIIDIDFVAKAPEGKEVEELTNKEIHKSLRSKTAIEQIKPEIKREIRRETREFRPKREIREPQRFHKRLEISKKEKTEFKDLLDKLIGTRGAFILDKDIKILGKVPTSELIPTIKSLRTGIYALVLDGIIDYELVKTCERSNIRYIVGKSVKINPSETRIKIITTRDL
jgi:DNA primase